MPSTLRLECASCGESAAVLNPSTRSIADLACPACGDRGTLGEKVSVALATVEPFPALAEPEALPPPISTRAIIARRKIGAPRIELHKNVDGSVKKIKVVPTR